MYRGIKKLHHQTVRLNVERDKYNSGSLRPEYVIIVIAAYLHHMQMDTIWHLDIHLGTRKVTPQISEWFLHAVYAHIQTPSHLEANQAWDFQLFLLIRLAHQHFTIFTCFLGYTSQWKGA